MMRSFLIYLSKATWARQMVTKWRFARRAASRFIAGETLEEAIEVVKILNSKGINATLDHLGEHTTSEERARQATNEIIEIVEAIDRAGVRANVSIKLTQIGLALNEDLCVENLKNILNVSKQHGTFVRIDMEDSHWVDTTLRIFHQAREECGCENIGLVIQAYLYRSEEDIKSLGKIGARVRLCKGAYKEPENIAYPKKADVDASFDRLTGLLLDSEIKAGTPLLSENRKIPPIPAIATHDENRVKFAKLYAEKVGLPKKGIEFQMLYGIRRNLQEQLAADGYPVRIYVPFGKEWYPYYVRRLAERPANVWFFISNFFRG